MTEDRCRVSIDSSVLPLKKRLVCLPVGRRKGREGKDAVFGRFCDSKTTRLRLLMKGKKKRKGKRRHQHPNLLTFPRRWKESELQADGNSINKYFSLRAALAAVMMGNGRREQWH
jgi:hypothetical protein